MNINKVIQTIHIYKELKKIAKTLHTLDENACNYELSKAQKTRGINLMKKAQELAKEYDNEPISNKDVIRDENGDEVEV